MDPAQDETGRLTAETNASRLELVWTLKQKGQLTTLDLMEQEIQNFGRLTSSSGCKTVGLVVPLAPGEAACVSMAVYRNLLLATDDSDALKALEALARAHPYERIRRLLFRAANTGLISPNQANDIHREMRSLGFWDSVGPFADDP